MKALDKAIEEAGGLAALARLLEMSPQAVFNWKVRNSVPPERAKQIEIALKGKVTVRELAPEFHRKWRPQ